nr:NAD(P)-dependent alcohol dehydrogenase [Parafrankia elaeagni]
MHTRYGPPEVVEVREVDRPRAGVGELLVRVHAATVNRTDCGYRAARPFILRLSSGLARPKATILGNELAGVVEAVGPEVVAFQPGDEIFGYNEGPFGAHAEYVAVRADGPLARIPAGVSFEQAAAATEGAHYALSFIRRIPVWEGKRVLVIGASGAIGSAAVQLLKCRGAQVTAVCGPDGVDRMPGLGADRVIDHTTRDFTRDFTRDGARDEARYDAVLDAVGASSWRRCRRLLRPGGVYASGEPGRFGQNLLLAALTPLARGRRVMFPFPSIDQQMVEHLGDLLAAGKFQPLLDRQYPLEEIVDAYRYVESGRKLGNVVISIRS